MTNTIDQNALGQLGLAQRSQDEPSNELGQEDFMQLMITQLRNQDPFKPMESGDFLGQLAQFGTVSGIEDMRKSFDGMAGAMQSNQTLQAAALVDRQVLVPSREAWLPPEGNVSGAVDVPAGATGVVLGIYDLGGTLVGQLPVDASAGGRHTFDWDGSLSGNDRAAPGFYELRATGQIAGEAVALDVLVSGRVESVSVGGSDPGIALTVTGLGVVDFSRVRGIA